MTAALNAATAPGSDQVDRRGSWLPNGAMIATRILELRKRRGLMIALLVVNVGLPAVYLLIRLILHAVDPHTYQPAGGYNNFTGISVGVLYYFGFIVAATLGCTAGSIDLTDGMFRHLVITGRSRLALYFARIPAGLAIVVPIVAAGFTIVCAVCCFAAPTKLYYQGIEVPQGLSAPALEVWAADHAKLVVCGFPSQNIAFNYPCYVTSSGQVVVQKVKLPPGVVISTPTAAQFREAASKIARQDYSDYSRTFLVPSNKLMVETGLWIELEAAVGLIVGLGLGSLLGQRTVAVILMIILEVFLTPVLSRHVIPHFINVQRGIVGVAMAHLEPSGLPSLVGGGPSGGSGNFGAVREMTGVAATVVVAWLVVWTALGAWRMATRDA